MTAASAVVAPPSSIRHVCPLAVSALLASALRQEELARSPGVLWRALFIHLGLLDLGIFGFPFAVSFFSIHKLLQLGRLFR